MPEGPLGCFYRFVKLLSLLLIHPFANLFAAVQQALQAVTYLCVRPGSGIFGGVLLRLPHRPLDFLPAHVAGALDRNFLPLPGVFVHGGDIDNSAAFRGSRFSLVVRWPVATVN